MLAETTVARKDAEPLAGFAVLELDYRIGKWKSVFKKKVSG